MSIIQHSATVEISHRGPINDYKYSNNGELLAIADSQGFIHIYRKDNQNKMIKQCDFKADQASILSISWADQKYGNIIGLGTFGNRVLVFQEQSQGWRQIAHNQFHTASINCVEWASYGFKLYAGSSDGKISILELSQKNWKIKLFTVSQSPIVSLSLQPLPFGQIISPQNNDSLYPRIAVASKDMKIRIFAHNSEQLYDISEKKFEKQSQNRNKSGYSLIKEYSTQKQSIKSLLWRPSWGNLAQNLESIKIIFCSQEGSLKSLQLTPSESHCKVISQGDIPICKISQSLTGNLISASFVHKNKHQTCVFQQIEDGEWGMIKNGII